MTSYGYRLFSMRLTRGFARKFVNFSECDDEHFVDIAERLLESLKDTAVGKPNLREDSPNTARFDYFGEPALQVVELSRIEKVIRAHVLVGTFGEHHKALAVPGMSPDVDVTKHAAARVHRFILVFPEEGHTGVAVMETIGRSCPIGLLQNWIGRQSRSDTVLTSTEVDDRPTKKRPKTWWRVHFRQMADDEHLQELIKSGTLRKIQLTKKLVLPDRKREVEKFRLTSSRIEGNVAVELGRVLADWWDRFRGGDNDTRYIVTPKEGASQLAVILGDEVNNLDFDDGWIVVKSEGGEKKIRPNQMPDLFTYFIDTVPPNDDELYQSARAKYLRLRQSSQIEVDWPSLTTEEPT